MKIPTSVKWPSDVENLGRTIGNQFCGRSGLQIFVEDTKNLNMWNNVIKTLLPNDVDFKGVIQLGSKNRVVAICKGDMEQDDRKKLYIIDGDFDIIKNKKPANLKHLHQLKAYCIENYLLHESAILKSCEVINPNLNILEATSRLAFQEWKQKNEQCYRQLFICYAIINKYLPNLSTVGYKVQKLTMNGKNNDMLCSKKVDKRIQFLYNKLSNLKTKNQIVRLKNKLEKITNNISFMLYVSGKDYLFKLIRNRIKLKIEEKHKMFYDDQLLVLLSQHTNEEVDPELKDKLKSLIK